MGPIELTHLTSRFTKPSEDFSLKRHLVNSTWFDVRREEVLCVTTGDADRPGGSFVWGIRVLVAEYRLSRFVVRCIEIDDLLEVAI